MKKEFLACGRKVKTPVFMPDATRGVIRGLDSTDLKSIGIEGVIVNSYHLSTQPGATVIADGRGLHNFMNWDGMIISDSGGFQLLSLVYYDPQFGSITDKGVTFIRRDKGKKQKYLFTPEKSIQTQFKLGSDVMVCLDDCPKAGCTELENKASVDRTIEWASRCKAQYERNIAAKKIRSQERPLLFAVIQGGNSVQERARCAHELIKIGFDGYGFGGWPLNEDNSFNSEILAVTASLMPDDLPKYALGVGNPTAIVECYKMGYNIFDCVLPTRDGRHSRLYILNEDLSEANILSSKQIYRHISLKDQKLARDFRPIDKKCDCLACAGYSISYLHHLTNIGDSLAGRLATLHNLRSYTRLIEMLRKSGG